MGQSQQPAIDPEIILARIDAEKSELRYQADQAVYSQGDPANHVFYVRAGRLKVTTISEAGKEAIVELHSPGDFFGEECLTGRNLRMTTVTALTECELVQMPKASVESTLRRDSEFTELLARYLVKHYVQAQEELVNQLLNTTEKRLARLLPILANYSKEDQPVTVVPKINQQTLAEMIGTTRTNVNLFMNKFRQHGLIEYNGDIRVNRPLLAKLLGGRAPIAAGDR
jgi:CRP/FNR family transcriptional regulator, cyclic AMP receptor protein